MIREPWFWHEKTTSARLVAGILSPLGAGYHLASKIKANSKKPALIPQCAVLCVGNATLGGVGKTPFALMLQRMLAQRKHSPVFLSRGYRGHLKGPIEVNPSVHDMLDVGDEALLLAERAPVWVSKDRAAGVYAAHQAGHTVLIADDGFQNPMLPKDFSFLLIAQQSLSGNQYVFPAGPFREPIEAAMNRTDMVIFVRQTLDEKPSQAMLKLVEDKPFCQAAVVPVSGNHQGRVHGFCGIGNPERFQRTLQICGYDLTGFTAYPDHHLYTDHDIQALQKHAQQEKSVLITTEKDYVRLSEDQRSDVLTLQVEMQVDKPEMVIDNVMNCINAKMSSSHQDGKNRVGSES